MIARTSFLVSIIVPVYNAEKFLDQCFRSVLDQDTMIPFEVSIFDDLSTDSSSAIIEEWKVIFEKESPRIAVVIGKNNGDGKGCGFAKNKAIEQSHGDWLCFQDADDVMDKNRLSLQYNLALSLCDPAEEKNAFNLIVGGNFNRIPENSTERYTQWCNRLTEVELYHHRFREVPIIMPTWFMHRSWFNELGGFEPAKGLPEDLIFFLLHMGRGGRLAKVSQPVIQYRYHSDMTSHAIGRKTLLKYRVDAFQKQVLPQWTSFMIWGSGRDGKQFFKYLEPFNQLKVSAFCDIDEKKIGTCLVLNHLTKQKVPIVHWSKVTPPFVTCVALARDSDFEKNLNGLGFQAGTDYLYFI